MGDKESGRRSHDTLESDSCWYKIENKFND